MINKANTCEKTTKQQAQSSIQGKVRLPQTKDLHQMIQGHEEKGFHEDGSPQVHPKQSKEPATDLHQCDGNLNVGPHTI